MGGTGERVVVVGAGIAGLACAFRLQEQGCDVVVLERTGPESVGGRMAGAWRDGVSVDLGAPLLARRYARMLRLIGDAGLSGQVLPSAGRVGVAAREAVHRGRTGTPLRLLTGGLLRPVPVRDRVRVLGDLLRLRGRLHSTGLEELAGVVPETLTDYARRRALSDHTLDLLLDPLNCTLTLAEPEDCAAAGALFFLAFLLGSGGLFTSAQGSAFLPRGLAARLPVTFHAEVTAVTCHGDEATVHWRTPGGPDRTTCAQAVALAVPADRVPALYDRLDPAEAALFRATRYARLLQVTFQLDSPTAEPSVLFTAARHDSPRWASAVLQHNLTPGRVPAGGGLVTCYLRASASDEHWNADDTKITDLVLADTHRLRVLPELDHARAVHVDRIDPCVVIRGPHDFAAIATARAAPVRPGPPVLPVGGDLYGYSTTIGSLKSGEQAAERILARLRSGVRATGPVRETS
jgi:oxygen-dependent protoporphyrinogen oxidase